MKKWLSVKDVAMHLSVSKETIYKWVKSNNIPAHRAGKFWRFDIDEIDNWVKCSVSSIEKSTPIKGDLTSASSLRGEEVAPAR